MAIQSIQVYVLGPSEDEFYTIEHMLAICGVYQYQVHAIHDPAEAMRVMASDEADCYILGSRALEEWNTTLAATLPIIALAAMNRKDVVSLDPVHLSLGQLLIAMRTAMRQRTRETKSHRSRALTMALAS